MLSVQAGNLFQTGKRSGSLRYAITATALIKDLYVYRPALIKDLYDYRPALIKDLYAYRPAFILFLPDKNAHKITGHLT